MYELKYIENKIKFLTSECNSPPVNVYNYILFLWLLLNFQAEVEQYSNVAWRKHQY